MKGKRVLKKQSNKNGLLGAYFASLFSVALCFVMLLGTTFAWFYTRSTSVGNEIRSGILKVDMLHVTEEGEKISLAEKSDHPVFSSELWTPDDGARTATVEVLNTGNVPLDYKLDFVLPEQETTASAAGLFTVYVDGEPVGLLDELLSDTEDKVSLATGQKLEPDAAQSISIELKMDHTKAHSFMGQSVPAYLKLEAYQHLGDDAEINQGGDEP